MSRQIEIVKNFMEESFDELSTCRREMHANPQTAYEETFSSNLVAGKLDEWGIQYERGWAKTGIIATIEGKRNDSKKSIGLRADLDALDITESTNLPYVSREQGKMHACGHDGHTATLLGAAKYLASTRNFNGKAILIFQPAEEVADSGAARMIEEGILNRYPMDMIYGIHNWPELPLGHAATRAGGMLASVDRFEVSISGRGGHGAMPHQTIDPIMTAIHMISQIQTIVSRELSALRPAVISVTNLHGGTGAASVIPEKTHFFGTVRTLNTKTREHILGRIKEICQSVAAGQGATAVCTFIKENVPTVNDAQAVQFSSAIAAELLGKQNVTTDCEPCMGGEDFGVFLQHIPGAFMFFGQAMPDSQNPCNRPLHNGGYDFNDELIKIGAAYFVRLVENALPI